MNGVSIQVHSAHLICLLFRFESLHGLAVQSTSYRFIRVTDSLVKPEDDSKLEPQHLTKSCRQLRQLPVRAGYPFYVINAIIVRHASGDE